MALRALPDLRNLRRLLIIRLSSIGDVTHAIPVSAALGEAFPHLEITWLVEEMSADVVRDNPYLHEVIVIPRARWKARRRSPAIWKEYLGFLAALRRRRFDATIDLQGYGKTALLALACGAPHRIGWWRMREGSQYVSHPVSRCAESIHRVDWFLDVAEALGAPRTPVRFPFVVPDIAIERATQLLSDAGVPPHGLFVAVNPAVGDMTRRWSWRGYAEVVRATACQYGAGSVLIGSDRDRELCERIRLRALELGSWPAGAPQPANIAGATTVKELAAVLQLCAAHVCGDTGSAHIAAALGRPVVGLYGPTDPAHAGPWGQADHVVGDRSVCLPGCSERGCLTPTAYLSERQAPDSPATGSEQPNADTLARCLARIAPGDVMEVLGRILNGSERA